MKIKLNWKEIYTVAKDDKLAELLNAHRTVQTWTGYTEWLQSQDLCEFKC